MEQIFPRTVNENPWEVAVYSGHSHWDKPIDELCDAFVDEKTANEYVKIIEKHRPQYRCEISRAQN